MGHEELKEIGIHAFGHRHKILKAVKEKLSGLPELGELFYRVGHHALKHTVEPPIATTSRKRPTPLSDQFSKIP